MRTYPRPLALAALGLLLAAPALSTPVAGVEPSISLSTALDSLRTESVRADIHFIASDELAGRDTPSEGLRIAARYIRARLQRLGFEPGASDGYLYRYPLRSTALDTVRSRVTVTGGASSLSLVPGRDCWYRSYDLPTDLEFRGPLVWGGNASRKDLSALQLEGRWLLLEDDGHGTGALRTAAKRAGATGLLFFPGADYDSEPYERKFGATFESASQGSVRYPRAEDEERGSDRGRTAQVHLSRAAAERLLASSPARPADSAAGSWRPKVGAQLGLEVVDERRLLAEGGLIQLENVCGLWRGDDPELSKEVILVSAHYDHVGTRGDQIYNGADDNGSGTTGLLAIAEALKTYGPMRRSVLLIWVSGEEKGLYGSRAWSEHPWLPEGCKPVANLNIDMIGRNRPDELYITPTKDHEQYNGIVRLAQRLAPLEGFPELGGADEYYHRSDQAMFANLGIPVAFLFNGVHEDYHQPSDTPDKIDCDKIRRVARLVVRLLDALQTDSIEF